VCTLAEFNKLCTLVVHLNIIVDDYSDWE
jgi:hypothetical protein